jgi:hypothetical protein
MIGEDNKGGEHSMIITGIILFILGIAIALFRVGGQILDILRGDFSGVIGNVLWVVFAGFLVFGGIVLVILGMIFLFI